MEAREKLERFSKEVIRDAAPASEAAATGGDRVGDGAFIGVLSEDRLSLIRSGFPEKSCAHPSLNPRPKT